MASVSLYLNFKRNTEEAFNFYRSVFGTEFIGGVARMGDIPPQDGMPELDPADKNLVMHVALPLIGDFILMGTDAPESMGFTVNQGNNVYINLQPDTRAEADKLFQQLSQDGKIEQVMAEMFWGAYYGSCTDKFGVQWMLNVDKK
ncbi:MAG: VOC family protein [Candidatus Kerfeldbacteria bacterium CG15_BIG_FIL_POST_REV_8_21_14_020_45_12]|uniref:VOC family protein n=1 Tax=Candidatus Kerfeldbacteria bacterium CG15_BIG_FIL_POST_REV_8_21_14_020_45_12 TaxID=2014247 RepID=A0A2M7H4V6_9BACT|nr:MAG: VOC family protein [Candidatus Kerfeldbacteria bacterium CG15_BIG_FIL_POST_REV_8_21_14_020_45_12]PJA93778.1 MAG: VOC family protein [Candidatus Kerfeldbacteria bacterium CG_4_9_14_3_um_filter_45_8]